MKANTEYRKFVAPCPLDRLRSYAVVQFRPVMAIEGPKKALKYFFKDLAGV